MEDARCDLANLSCTGQLSLFGATPRSNGAVRFWSQALVGAVPCQQSLRLGRGDSDSDSLTKSFVSLFSFQRLCYLLQLDADLHYENFEQSFTFPSALE